MAVQASPELHSLAVSSVDELGGRLDVADVLARTTLSVGVNGLSIRMLCADALGDGACPYCEYVTATPPLAQAAVIAGQTGLPEGRVATLLPHRCRMPLLASVASCALLRWFLEQFGHRVPRDAKLFSGRVLGPSLHQHPVSNIIAKGHSVHLSFLHPLDV